MSLQEELIVGAQKAVPVVQANGVFVKRGDGHVIEIRDFRLLTGEAVCLDAPSGAGKSTVLGLLSGFLPPDPQSPPVSQFGRQIRAADKVLPHPQMVGMMMQSPTLNPALTVRQNILLPQRIAKRALPLERLEMLAVRLGLQDRLKSRPLELSLGQRQRAAAIRALLVPPRLLLLDEPYSALDRENKRELSNLFIDARRHSGTAIVLATHQPPESRFGTLRRISFQQEILGHVTKAVFSQNMQITEATP